MMVKLASWIERRRMAMQLLLCLVIGLRMISASLHAFTCTSRQPTSADQRQDASHRSDKWQLAAFEQNQHDASRMQPRAIRNHAASQAVAADFQEPGRSHPSNGHPQQQQQQQQQQQEQEQQQEQGTTFNSTPTDFGPVFSDGLNTGSSSSPTSDALSPNGQESPLDLPPSESPLASTSTATSSTSEPPNMPSNLPNLDVGGGQTSTPAAEPPAGLSNSQTGQRQEYDQAHAPSTSATAAIAAGVTVPVGVVALGLAALLILHKQRQRRAKLRAAHTKDSADPEMGSASPGPVTEGKLMPTPSADTHGGSTVGTGSHDTTAVPDEGGQEAQARPDSAEAATTWETVVRGRPVLALNPAARFPPTAYREPGQETALDPPRTPVFRARSLKRKPVPRVTDSLDTPPQRQMASQETRRSADTGPPPEREAQASTEAGVAARE